MKKRFTAFLLVCVMMLPLAVPVMATGVDAKSPINVEVGYVEITPFIEFTQIYWRIYHGQLQFRVWSLTNGIWLTPWTNANAQS